MNGLIINWGKAKDAATVYFGCSYTSSAVVVIARVADSSADANNASSGVQPFSTETGSTIKTGFKPHFGNSQNSGHWIAIGY